MFLDVSHERQQSLLRQRNLFALMSAGLGVMFTVAAGFATTRERVQPPPGARQPFRDDLRDVLTCRPWLVMFVLTLLCHVAPQVLVRFFNPLVTTWAGHLVLP